MTEFPSRSRIVVVGSVNQDYIVRVSRWPEPGETVLAHSLLRQPGGKGANQAVAAARLQADVSLIGAVGDDTDGMQVLRQLRLEGVDTTNVEIMTREQTGLAVVTVFDSGENSIVVVAGSNFSLTTDRITTTVARLADEAQSSILVVQAELPSEIIAAAVHAGHSAGSRVILNLAPFQRLGSEVLAVCDPLVLNEGEATALTGLHVHDVASALIAVEGAVGVARSVVITIGADGAVWGDASGTGHVAAPKVREVVDTTGAGDAFVGALAARFAGGASLQEALQLGVLAGTFAVQSPGAQTSYPTMSDLRSTDYAKQAPATAR